MHLNITVSNVLGAISAGVEMSLVIARRQLLMSIAGYAQEVSSRHKDRRNRMHVDLLLWLCAHFCCVMWVGQKTGLYLRVDNFAAVSGKETCHLSEVSKFCLENL